MEACERTAWVIPQYTPESTHIVFSGRSDTFCLILRRATDTAVLLGLGPRLDIPALIFEATTERVRRHSLLEFSATKSSLCGRRLPALTSNSTV